MYYFRDDHSGWRHRRALDFRFTARLDPSTMIDAVGSVRRADSLVARYAKYLVWYLVFRGALDSWRHLRARGIKGTVKQLIDAIRQVRFL